MSEMKIIEVKQSVFEDNNQDANRLRAQLKEEKTFLLNLMSSPGSGKTTTLLALAKELKDKIRMGVMEADIDSAVDAETMAAAGVRSIQIHLILALNTRQNIPEYCVQLISHHF